MDIFITGGSGFLGKTILKRLIQDGHSVTALTRSKQSAKVVEDLGASALLGDITNVKKFSASLSHIDILIHCAAPVEFWGPWHKFNTEIVESTKALAEECITQGVKRFIYISSESVLQDRSDLIDIDENHPYPKEPNSYYGKAKKLAEQHLLLLCESMEVIILRPTFIWGPGCPAFKTLTQKVRSGQFMWINGGNIRFEAVYVDNVAEAVVLSLTNGRNGGLYFITDQEESTVRDFFATLFTKLGLNIPKVSLPKFLVWPVATVVESVWRLFQLHSNPPISRFDLSFVAMSRRYLTAHATYELKYKPIVSRSLGFENVVLDSERS